MIVTMAFKGFDFCSRACLEVPPVLTPPLSGSILGQDKGGIYNDVPLMYSIVWGTLIFFRVFIKISLGDSVNLYGNLLCLKIQNYFNGRFWKNEINTQNLETTNLKRNIN